VLRALARLVVRLVAAVVVIECVIVALYRVVDPPITPVMVRNAAAYGVTKQWVELDRVAPALLRAVIAAEDGRFFEHDGVDWEALSRASDYNERHGGAPRRGGSTITMQCARNVFLWQGKSYVRKGLEIALARLLEAAWGKRRILEVYVNVIEWGPGVYGVEAAARRSFGVPAAALDAREAALLAAVLPSPRRWSAAAPTRYVAERAASIERRAAAVRLDPLRLR
jgi:monofunctional glycosyltransferase